MYSYIALLGYRLDVVACLWFIFADVESNTTCLVGLC